MLACAIGIIIVTGIVGVLVLPFCAAWGFAQGFREAFRKPRR
jgi:hypothetical protein